MRSRWILAGLLALTLGAGCFTPAWRQDREIVRTMGLVVEVERCTGEVPPTGAVFAHPAEVSPEFLAVVLGGLQYRSMRLFGDASPAAAVHPMLVPTVADTLADGLRHCSPTERLRFLVRNPSLGLGFLPSERVTRGVIFVTPPDTLNLAFDLVGTNPDPDATDPATTWGDPTQRIESTISLMVPAGFQRHVDGVNRERPLWLVGKIEALPAVSASEPLPPSGTSAGVTAGSPASPAPSPAPAVEPSSLPPPTLPPPTPGPTPPAGALSSEEKLARLRYLEELRRDGAITEAEYERRKQALLYPD